ncbi:MAG TPA: hypothetical protein VGJ84_19670 [Polyangiaceae bacterium]|jgi:hypothetical protein
MKNLAALLALALSSGGAGCSSNESKGPPQPAGPPEIQILELVATGEVHWLRGDSQPLLLGCDLSAAVLVGPHPDSDSRRLVNWTLRPPGGCGATLQCGFIRLEAGPADGPPQLSSDSAITIVPLDFSKLSTVSGVQKLRATLLNDNGSTFAGGDGGPVFDEVSVEVQAPTNCPLVQGDAGVDGG